MKWYGPFNWGKVMTYSGKSYDLLLEHCHVVLLSPLPSHILAGLGIKCIDPISMCGRKGSEHHVAVLQDALNNPWHMWPRKSIMKLLIKKSSTAHLL